MMALGRLCHLVVTIGIIGIIGTIGTIGTIGIIGDPAPRARSPSAGLRHPNAVPA